MISTDGSLYASGPLLGLLLTVVALIVLAVA